MPRMERSELNRHPSIRIVISVVALLVFSFTLPPASRAAPTAPLPDRVVFPTGEWPADVENVQAAIDLGGTVLLKAHNLAGQPAAFNFGVLEDSTSGLRVFVRNDVWILGEAVGPARTTILGGYRPISVGLDGQGGFSLDRPHVRIEGISFEGSGQAAIDVYQSASVEIVGNRIANVVMRYGIGVGLNVFGGGAQRRVTGTVTIANNVFENPVVGGTFVHGIVLDNVAADVHIVQNHLETTQDFTGILVVRQVEGTVRIADNFVAPHPDEPGQGIGIYIYANDRWDAIRTSSPVYEVVGNRVVSEEYGIGLVGQRGAIDRGVIERNHISTLGPYPWAEGIVFGGNVSNVRVQSNRIDGAGAFAVDIFAFEPNQSAASNTFAGNNLSAFRAATADLFLDGHTRDTVVAGRSGTVIDLGSGNQITGMSKIGQGEHIGPQIGKRGWLLDREMLSPEEPVASTP